MTTLHEAAQQALEALKMMRDEHEEYACPACDHADAAIYALKTALAEPVGCPNCALLKAELEQRHLYQPVLTDEIIADLWYQNGTYYHHFARAIERYLTRK